MLQSTHSRESCEMQPALSWGTSSQDSLIKNQILACFISLQEEKTNKAFCAPNRKCFFFLNMEMEIGGLKRVSTCWQERCKNFTVALCWSYHEELWVMRCSFYVWFGHTIVYLFMLCWYLSHSCSWAEQYGHCTHCSLNISHILVSILLHSLPSVEVQNGSFWAMQNFFDPNYLE